MSDLDFIERDEQFFQRLFDALGGEEGFSGNLLPSIKICRQALSTLPWRAMEVLGAIQQSVEAEYCILGSPFFSALVHPGPKYVRLVQCAFAGADLASLPNPTGLEHLSIVECNDIKNLHLVLSRFTMLSMLVLHGTRVDQWLLDCLLDLPHLYTVGLDDCGVSGEAVQALWDGYYEKYGRKLTFAHRHKNATDRFE